MRPLGKFHAWWHFFKSTMRVKISETLLRQLTGHSTEAVTEYYSRFHPEVFLPFVAIEESLGI